MPTTTLHNDDDTFSTVYHPRGLPLDTPAPRSPGAASAPRLLDANLLFDDAGLGIPAQLDSHCDAHQRAGPCFAGGVKRRRLVLVTSSPAAHGPAKILASNVTTEQRLVVLEPTSGSRQLPAQRCQYNDRDPFACGSTLGPGVQECRQ